MEHCLKCKKELCNDDIAFHKKMVNRGANEFMCIECLCIHFDISIEKANELIERFRAGECTLFV